MIEDSSIYLRCPGCECAVRKLDGSPCPNCSRCVFCGQKLKDTDCECGLEADRSQAASSFKEFIIPADEVERETRRMAIRKELESIRMWADVIVGALLTSVGGIVYNEVFGGFFWKSALLWAIGLVILMISFHALNRRLFQRIEDKLLEAQFGELQ